MHVAQAITASCYRPAGSTLLGYLDSHPCGRGGACAVLRLASGIEVAWDGSSIRNLPRNWRTRVTLTPAAV